ncbi:hypothetical protein GS582_13530 [Rhodococcus hoagii]|nr:hypothetical protein [Prescottella equi]
MHSTASKRRTHTAEPNPPTGTRACPHREKGHRRDRQQSSPHRRLDDHKTALAFVGELRRCVEDQRHTIIKYALAGGLSWDQIARALYADVDELRERYRARIDHELGRRSGALPGRQRRQ